MNRFDVEFLASPTVCLVTWEHFHFDACEELKQCRNEKFRFAYSQPNVFIYFFFLWRSHRTANRTDEGVPLQHNTHTHPYAGGWIMDADMYTPQRLDWQRMNVLWPEFVLCDLLLWHVQYVLFNKSSITIFRSLLNVHFEEQYGVSMWLGKQTKKWNEQEWKLICLFGN